MFARTTPSRRSLSTLLRLVGPRARARVVHRDRAHLVPVQMAELGTVVVGVGAEHGLDERQVGNRVAQREGVLRGRVEPDPAAVPVGERRDPGHAAAVRQGLDQLHERYLTAVVGDHVVGLRPVAQDHLGKEDRVVVAEHDLRPARLRGRGDLQGLRIGRSECADAGEVGSEVPDGALHGGRVGYAAVDDAYLHAVAQRVPGRRGELDDADVGVAGVVRCVAVGGGVGGVREQQLQRHSFSWEEGGEAGGPVPARHTDGSMNMCTRRFACNRHVSVSGRSDPDLVAGGARKVLESPLNPPRVPLAAPAAWRFCGEPGHPRG